MIRKSTSIYTVASVFLLGALVATVTLPLRGSRFGPIDDPKFLALAERGRLIFFKLLLELPNSLNEIGKTSAFRPVFYLWDGLGVTLVGASAEGLYLVRSACFLVALVLTMMLVRNMVLIVLPTTRSVRELYSTVVGTSAAVALSSSNGWLGIVPRLGPAESVQVVGFSAAALSAMKLLIEKNMSRSHFLGLIFGIFLCGGAKEPGLVSVLLLVLVAHKIPLMMRRSPIDRLLVTSGLAIVAGLVLNLGIFLITSGVDQYGNIRDSQSAWEGIYSRFASDTGMILIVALCVIRVHTLGSESMSQSIVFRILATCWLAWLLEGAVYGLDGPVLRYRIISQMIEIWIVVVAVCLGLSSLLSRPNRWNVVLQWALLLGAINLVFYPTAALSDLRSQNLSTKTSTVGYWQQVEEIANAAKESNHRVLIFSVDAAGSYEPISSLGTYLRSLGTAAEISVFNLEERDPIWNSPEWLKVESFMTQGKVNIFQPYSIGHGEKSICVSFAFTLSNPDSPFAELTDSLCSQTYRF